MILTLQNTSRVYKTCIKSTIFFPAEVFNTEESGFSTRRAGRGRVKAIMRSKERSYAIDVDWKNNTKQVKLRQLVSTDRRVWTFLTVILNVRKTIGSLRTELCRIQPPSYLLVRL